LAEDLLPKRGTGDFNQGLMELGALICRPKKPVCTKCPVSIICKAKRSSVQKRLPVRTPRKPIPHIHVTAGVIQNDGKFLITLRPPSGLLGGLWEFPGGKQENGESLDACLRREIREELGIEIDVGDEFMTVNHAYSHFKITLHVFACRYDGGKIRLNGCDDFQWITVRDLDRFAFPAADRRVIRRLQEEGFGGRR
jgi:A/G-specific adenine glycosylase